MAQANQKTHEERIRRVDVVYEYWFEFDNSKSTLHVMLNAGKFEPKMGITLEGIILDFIKESISDNDEEEFQRYATGNLADNGKLLKGMVHPYSVSGEANHPFSYIVVKGEGEFEEGYAYTDFTKSVIAKATSTLLDDYFDESRNEILTILRCVFKHLFNIGASVNETLIQEFISDRCDAKKKERLNIYLQDVSNLYNSYIDALNLADSSPDSRTACILANDEFRKDIEYLSNNFKLEMDFDKATTNKTKGNKNREHTFDELKSIAEELFLVIETRDQYKNLGHSAVGFMEKRKHIKDMKKVRAEFDGVFELLEELENYQSGVLKQTVSKEFLEQKINETKSKLYQSAYILDKLDYFSKIGEALDNIQRRAMFGGGYTTIGSDSVIELRQVPKLTKKILKQIQKYNVKKAVEGMLNKTEIDFKACEKIYPKYRNNCYSLMNSNMKKITNWELGDVFSVEYLPHLLDMNIRMLSFQNNMLFMLCARSDSNATASKLDKGEYYIISDYIKRLTELLKKMDEFCYLSDGQKENRMREFISDSNDAYKVGLYQKWEKMYSDFNTTSPKCVDAVTLNNAFKKSLSGNGFFSNLTNSTPALEKDLEQKMVREYHMFKSQEQITDVVNHIAKLLEEILMKFTDTLSTKEPKESNDKLLDTMVKELEGKGLSKEEALVFLGRLAEKVAEPGYYSNKDTEDTENSRFSAMNRR